MVWPSDCIRKLVKKCQDCPELFFHRTGVDGKLTEHYGYAIHKYLDNLENDQNVGVVQRRYGLRQCYRLQKRLGQHPHDTLARYIVQQDPNITFAQARQRCHDRALAGKKYDRYVTLFDNPGILFVLPYDKPPTL